MSIGNLKTDGNKGNNFPWQLKMLQGLTNIYNGIVGISVDTALLAKEATLLQVETNTTGVLRTPGLIRVTGSSGTVPTGKFSMSFASVGTANATVGGMILKPGETINFDAGALNNTLTSVAYDTTTVGAELIIIVIS